MICKNNLEDKYKLSIWKPQTLLNWVREFGNFEKIKNIPQAHFNNQVFLFLKSYVGLYILNK